MKAANSARWISWALVALAAAGCDGAEFKEARISGELLGKPLEINTRPRTLAIGDGVSVGVRHDGSVWTWGNNHEGRLARPVKSAAESATPRQIPGFGGGKSVSVGTDHVLVLKADGSVWGWGRDDLGQLSCQRSIAGNSRPSGPAVPARLDVNAKLRDVYAANGVSYFATEVGDVLVCGGSLVPAPDNEGMSPGPRLIPGLKDIVRVWGGKRIVFALDSKGHLYSAGTQYGLLGRKPFDKTPGKSGEATYRGPALVELPSAVVDVAMGAGSVAALLADGTVWTWGDNVVGQLGRSVSDRESVARPARIATISRIVRIGARLLAFAAVSEDGTLVWWGEGLYGDGPDPSSARGANKNFPVILAKTVHVDELVGGGSAFAYVDRSAGAAFYWGWNRYGERGTGTVRTDIPFDYVFSPERSGWAP